MLNQSIEDHSSGGLLNTITEIELKGFGKGTGRDADIIGRITHFRLSDNAVDMATVAMKAVVGKLVADKGIDGQTTSESNRKTKYIKRGKEPASNQIPDNHLL